MSWVSVIYWFAKYAKYCRILPTSPILHLFALHLSHQYWMSAHQHWTGPPKGSWEQNASVNHLNLLLCFRGLYKCVSTLCKNRPACFPKKRLHRNSKSSLKYSVIFILGPYMYLLFILWASMCWQKENPCKCWYSVFIVTTFRYLSNCLFNVTCKILQRVLC